jgi:hypothetical protein
MITDPNAAPPVERELLTFDELLALTGWKRTKTFQGARNGTLPFPVLRHAHRYYFSRKAVMAWINGHGDSGRTAYRENADPNDTGRSFLTRT